MKKKDKIPLIKQDQKVSEAISMTSKGEGCRCHIKKRCVKRYCY